MLRAAIYARYSSERQKATSIEDQVTVCRDAASRFGCVISEDHIYADRELSGTISQRPAYSNLMASAKARKFDAIVVESQDRLWRDQGTMHDALKLFRFWGIKVFSVSTGSDLTDKTGKLMASVVGWKDEIFAEDLRDKTRRGMMGQIKRGFSAGGRAYGYRSEPMYNAEHQTVGSRRVIDRAEAAVIQRIFKLYVAGYSPKTIARVLNDEGVAPPRVSKGKRSLGWTWTTIAGNPRRALGILHNPCYVGRLIWNRSQKVLDPETRKRVMRPRPRGEWMASDVPGLRIIPQDLWEAAQARRERQHKTAKGNTHGRRAQYLLSGLLECGERGSHFVIQAKRPGTNYYGCAAHADRGSAICSNNKLVPRNRIEERLLQVIFEEVFSPETVAYLTERVNEALRRKAEPHDTARECVRTELAQARLEMANIQTAIRQGILTPTTRSMLEEQERRIEELETALQTSAQPRKVIALPSVVEDYLGDLRGTLGRDTDRARALLTKMVGKVKLRKVGNRLVAEVRGNVLGLLDVEGEERFGSRGAGRGI